MTDEERRKIIKKIKVDLNKLDEGEKVGRKRIAYIKRTIGPAWRRATQEEDERPIQKGRLATFISIIKNICFDLK